MVHDRQIGSLMVVFLKLEFPIKCTLFSVRNSRNAFAEIGEYINFGEKKKNSKTFTSHANIFIETEETSTHWSFVTENH